MYSAKKFPAAAIFASVIVTLFIAACGSEETDKDKVAGRANVEAMASEHADDTTEPSIAAQTVPASAVISETLAYTEIGDELVYGYFAVPADMFEPLPAIIVIHEWWGLNDNVRAMADRLAGEGYIVFAVDMYAGKVAETAAEARELMLGVVEEPEIANDNIRAAYDFVSNKAGAPRVGSLGWCFGGGWSLKTAQLFPDELDAAVIYYGQVTDDMETLRPIGAPLLGLFGAEDRGIKVESVNAFAEALGRLHKNYDVHIYPGVGHAFANPSGENYDGDAAEDAWRRTLQFFGQHLVKTDDT